MRELPQWSDGDPPYPGAYLTFSAEPKRTDAPSVSVWDGKVWQSYLGWYDHAITHWMVSAMTDPPALPHAGEPE